MTRRYTAELVEFIGPEKDVPAPDMNTNEQTMAWMMDTYSMHMRQTVNAVVTGKPLNIGGSRGRREATGRGVLICCDQAIQKLGMEREKTRVIVQGFGNVGSNAAQLMHQAGYKVIGIGEWDGGLYNANGIDIDKLVEHKQRRPPTCLSPIATSWLRARWRTRSPARTLTRSKPRSSPKARTAQPPLPLTRCCRKKVSLSSRTSSATPVV
jgi:glutamate dehydrogenase/leucine dehydrogenase